jgi:RNA polymerase sigma-70 factor (ECF subfamily)
VSALVALAVAGHRPAVSELLAGVRPVVVRYCRSRVPAAHVEDVAQDVCLALLSALPRFEDRGVPFEAFAVGVARHVVAGFYRRAARDRALLFADVPDTADCDCTPERVAELRELSRALLLALANLTEQQRAVVLLRAAGLSADEIAEAVCSTPGAVRVAHHRAVNRLRTEPLPV